MRHLGDKKTKNNTIARSLLGLAILASMLLIANNNQIQSSIVHPALAQNATVPTSAALSETFSAHGTLGSLIIPVSVASSNITSAIRGMQGSVIGGNWILDVSGGTLRNFNVNIEMLGLDGKLDMMHSITGLKNVAAVTTTPSAFNRIFLNNNNTSFKGDADITTNGKVEWSNVPVVVSLINGKLMNLSIDITKTSGHFTGIPILGIATSFTKQ
jgi:hypothetical protein